MKQRFLNILIIFLFPIMAFPLATTGAGIPDAWNQNLAYSSGDFVIEGGVTYQALMVVPAGTTISSTAYWGSLESLASGFSNPGSPPAETPNPADATNLNPPADDNASTDGGGEGSTVVRSGLPSATDTQFVNQQYMDFLGREPDSEGLTYWVTGLDNGSLQRSDLVNAFVFSDEFQEKVAPVSRLYQAYFLRIPDTSGLSYWINEKLNGTSLDTISEAFAGSSEFQDRYGSVDNSAYTSLVYNNVLGRAPDQSGLDFWTNSLNAGASRGSVMTGFSESIEYKDASLNQIRVIAFYYGMLRRAPDQAGFDFWVGVLNNGGSALDLINGFLDATEYQSRFAD
jgi:hypothetical protein